MRLGVDGLPLPMNPNVVEPFGASAPFQAAFRTLTVEPVVMQPQLWVMHCPAGQGQVEGLVAGRGGAVGAHASTTSHLASINSVILVEGLFAPG